MIYSEDINKICSLCRFSQKATGSETHLECTKRNEYTPFDFTCEEFVYDIFKKPTRRKKRLKKNFSAEDFTL